MDLRRGVAALAVSLATAVTVAGCTPTGAARQSGPPQPVPADLPTRAAPSPPPADGRSDPVADTVYPQHGNPAIDVLSYRLSAAWAPDSRVLTGSAAVRLRATRAITEVALDFAPTYTVTRAATDAPANGAPAGTRANGAPAGATANGAPGAGTTANGAPGAGATVTTTAWRSGKLVVALPRPLEVGGEVTVTIEYHGTPTPTDFPGHRTDVDTSGAHVTDAGALYAMQEPYGAHTWFPCSDQPSDKALLDVRLDVPTGWAGVSSGRPAATEAIPAGTRYHWRSDEPIATYLVALAVGRYTRLDDTGPDGLPLSYWLPADTPDGVRATVRKLPKLLDWLQRRFGPYPFASGGVVIVPDRSGMETQGMITLGPLDGAAGEAVLLHELAHHWFGDAVTPRTWADLWLNEGFAMYAQVLYEVDQQGANLADELRKMHDGDVAVRARAGPPGNYRADRFADRNVYYGPALMLHELRGMLGDRLFFAMAHDWVQHHRYGNADRASFTAWANDYTGRDLAPLLAKWLDSATTPTLPA